MKFRPNPFQTRTLWSALTGLSIVVLAALLVGAIWLTGQVLAYLQPVLVPLAVAGIIAYLLDPIVGWLQRRKLSRIKAVLIVFASSLFGLTIIVFLAIGAFRQLGDLKDEWGKIAEHTAKIVETVLTHPLIDPTAEPQPSSLTPEETLPAATPQPTEESDTSFNREKLTTLFQTIRPLLGKATAFLTRGASQVFGLIGFALGFLLVPIYLYYFLKEGSAIREHWKDYVPLRASYFKDEVVATLLEINSYLIAFFRGQVLVSLIDGVLVGIALTLFGMTSSGLLIGVLLAGFGIIPFIGNFITLIPACLLAFATFSNPDNQHFLGSNPWIYVACVAGIFIVVQQINGLITQPKIVGDSVGLHPMTVIFSMLFWSLLLGGFLGALLAVPLTAAVKVLFRRYVWERKLNSEPSQKPPPPDLDVSTEPSPTQTAETDELA